MSHHGVFTLAVAHYGLSSRPEILIPEGDENRSGGTCFFAHATEGLAQYSNIARDASPVARSTVNNLAVSMKANLVAHLLLTANVLVKLNDRGLKSKVVPLLACRIPS